MADAAKFDKNMASARGDGEGCVWLDVPHAPIQVRGLGFFEAENAWNRLPEALLPVLRDKRPALVEPARHTAGDVYKRQAGMPAQFDKDLKFAYTSKNFLELLKCIREIIDDGSTPKEMSSVDAGKRWNMFLTGQTMIFGKGLANFEGLAVANNEKLAANDGTAVEGSIEAEYVVLPVPTFFGEEQQAQGSAAGYGMFRTVEEPDPVHQANVMKAMYFMASGEPAAFTCNELYLSGLSESSRTAMAAIENTVPRSEDNAKAMELLTSQAAEARPDIPAEMTAQATRLMDEVIVPKFQALLAGERCV